MSEKPVIAVPADRRLIGIHPFHMVGEKYITALKDAAEGLPWMIPATGNDGMLEDVFSKIDGLFLTGVSLILNRITIRVNQAVQEHSMIQKEMPLYFLSHKKH